MLTNLEDGVVFKQAIEDIERLARAARNDLGAENRILVGDVGIDADGFLVIAVVSGV
jgi:hypothetical protein